jgi:hypothetical protein
MFHHSTPIVSNHEKVNQEDSNITKALPNNGAASQKTDDDGYVSIVDRVVLPNTVRKHVSIECTIDHTYSNSKLQIMECDTVTVATVGTSVSYSTHGTTFSGQTMDSSSSAALDHWQFWKRTDLRILAMPFFYVTEPDTATFPKQELKEVTARLLNVFSSLSLMVSYDRGDEIMTASAACRCMDGVGFHVLIWEKNAREYQMEIRHTSGCGTLFRQKRFCDAILAAVTGTKEEEDEVSGPEDSVLTQLQADPLYFDLTKQDEEVRLLDSVWRRCRSPIAPELEQLFAMLDTLLTSPRLDAIVEGFATLLDVTHPKAAGFRMAAAVATALLTSSSSSSQCSTIVLSLALAEEWPDFVEMRPSDLRLHESLLAEYSYQAWKVVAQSVSFLDADGLTQFVQQADTVLARGSSDDSSLEEVLLRTVHMAREQPHRAYCATHILARVSSRPEMVPATPSVPHYGLQQATQRWAATVESR